MKRFVHIGTDPEFFFINDGRFKEFPISYNVPPYVFRKYKYLEPIRVFDQRHYVFWEKDGYIIHEDGAAFELTTPPYDDIITMRNSVIGIIKEAEKELGVKFTVLPAVPFTVPEEFKDDEQFIKACEFGCNPDIEGYMPEINLTTHTITAEDINYRFGGGHIMIEFPAEMQELFNKFHHIFSRLLAITVGIRMIAYSKVPYLLKERAKFYGTPCKYRDDKIIKNLFEYRTPSNEWLSFTERELKEIENGINVALTLFNWRNDFTRSFLGNFIAPVADAIYTVNQVKAQKLLDEIKELEEKIE